jgi:ADP-ribose pyrophosphatase
MDDHEWPVVESATEYETGWYEGGYDRVEQPDGSEKRYYWAALDPAVVVVAVDGDDVVFVEQYRPTVREHCLELPAGIVEGRGSDIDEQEGQGESYETAAARELREETGLDPAETHLVEAFWCATGVLRHRRGIVVATDLSPIAQDLDENEFLTVKRVPTEEALARAREGHRNEATLEGLLLAREDGFL